MPKVCLDAGHYGKYNRSPGVPEYYESEMTWKLHLLLKKHLEALGVDVITTRSDQTKDLALLTRGKKSKDCDLFLSIHSNAAGTEMNESVDYPIVYIPISGKGDTLGSALAECIAKVMGTKQKAQSKSKKGTSGDYYGVMRGASAVGTVGLLAEHSFHTNTTAAKWLLDETNLDKLAKAEAAVIAGWLKTHAKSQATPYKVKVIADALNIRKTPNWLDEDVVGVITDKGIYTIVAETKLDGVTFGKLKSGKGWISLGDKYVKKL